MASVDILVNTNKIYYEIKPAILIYYTELMLFVIFFDMENIVFFP